MTIYRFERDGAGRGRFAECRWVPWAIVAAFVVIAAVNGGLVYFALESWPGLTTYHAYDEGLAYNQVIDETQKEAKLGWALAIAYVPDAKGSLHGSLVVDAGAKDGTPLSALAIKAELVRPLGQVETIPLSLTHTSAGHYAAPVTLPLAGQWDVYVTAAEDGKTLHTGRRILAP